MEFSRFQRQVLWLAVALLTVGKGSAADGGTLQLAINRESGGVSLRNSTDAALDFTAYSITSEAGDLLFTNWTSIAGNYDAGGDMSVDIDDSWLQLSAAGSNSDLSEGEFNGDGGRLSAGGAIFLGDVWNTSGSEDLAIDVVLLSGEFSAPFDVIYYEEDADFNLDGRVDGQDFLIWQLGYGIAMDATVEDGDADADGDVDTQDFLIWQGQFAGASGMAEAASGRRLAQSKATPEPTTICLLLWFAVAAGCRRVPRRQIGWPVKD